MLPRICQSPSRQCRRLQRSRTKKHALVPFAFKDDWLAAAAVFKKWTITAKIIPKDKASFTPRADAVHVQKLFQYKVREANEKARLELKTSTSDFCTSEQFDAILPPSLRYISKACGEKILEEIVSSK
jgi:hypothetical protein